MIGVFNQFQSFCRFLESKSPFSVRRTISTYVCQTRGQLRGQLSQEPHVAYPRLIQHSMYPNGLQFQSGQTAQPVANSTHAQNLHRTILYGAADGRGPFR